VRRSSSWGCVLGLAIAACGDASSTYKALPQLRASLEEYGVTPEPLEVGVAALAWQAPPSTCSHVYRVRAQHDPELMHEGNHEDVLAIGLPPDAARADGAKAWKLDGVPPPPGETVALRLYYRGFRAEKRGTAREVHVSAQEIGPTAPTAACTPRTWDPMDDALALAWPKLPARLVAVDEHWIGQRVEGRCNTYACRDPETGAAGRDYHHLTCVTPDWDERLAGVYEIGGERFALVERRWTDGHEQPIAQAHGLSLVSIDHGRPAWALVVIDQKEPQMTAAKRMSPIVRTWSLVAIDACPGSLASVGWARPEDVVFAHDLALDELASSDELKRRDEESQRRAAEPEGDLFEPPS
jgi:hypothetical protein